MHQILQVMNSRMHTSFSSPCSMGFMRSYKRTNASPRFKVNVLNSTFSHFCYQCNTHENWKLSRANILLILHAIMQNLILRVGEPRNFVITHHRIVFEFILVGLYRQSFWLGESFMYFLPPVSCNMEQQF